MDIFSRKLEPIEWPRDRYRSKFDGLATALRSKEPYVLFIGAGISKNLYPDWEELVSFITTEMTMQLSDDEQKNVVRYALSILERCKSTDCNKFYSLIRQKFSPCGVDYKPLHRDMLSLPLVGFITTNIDVCLVRAARSLSSECRLNNFFYYPNHLPSSELKNHNLFHIHGIIINHNDEDTLQYTVLTESDYNKAYSNNIHHFLWSAFNEVCMIFAGYSLNDPPIKRILEKCKKHQDELRKLPISQTSGTVNHFIFLPSIYRVDTDSGTKTEDNQSEDEQDDYFRETYNLYVIRYKTYDEKEHTQLNKIINNLIVMTEKIRFGG